MTFKEFLEQNKVSVEWYNDNYSLEISHDGHLEKWKLKALKNKEKLNELFDIDGEVGYRAVRVRIDKTKLVSDFVRDWENEIFRELYEKDYNKIPFKIELKDNDYRTLVVYLDKIDARNKKLSKVVTEEWKLSYLLKEYGQCEDSVFRKLIRDYFLIDDRDVSYTLYHKVVIECKSEMTLYIVTSNAAMIMMSESDEFGSCHRIGGDYHYGNWQNWITPNVFSIVRLNSDGNLKSRSWGYICWDDDGIPSIIIARIYNATRMTGAHIVEALKQALSHTCFVDLPYKYVIKDADSFKIYFSNYSGYNDIEHGRRPIVLEYKEEVKKINFKDGVCVACGSRIYLPPGNGWKEPVCEDCGSSEYLVDYCEICGGRIYEDDDYNVIDEENYVHERCGERNGMWYCNTCETYHLDCTEEYIIYDSWEVISVSSCNTDNAYYCEVCHRYYVRGYVHAVSDAHNVSYICDFCVGDTNEVWFCNDCNEYHWKEVEKYGICDSNKPSKEPMFYTCDRENYYECDECGRYIDVVKHIEHDEYISDFCYYCYGVIGKLESK